MYCPFYGTTTADVIFLQETHIMAGSAKVLPSNKLPMHFHAPESSHSGGTAILFSNATRLDCSNSKVDCQGIYLFLKGNLNGKPVMLASIYAPNKGQIAFIKFTFSLLAQFQDGPIILGADFNYLAYPKTDRPPALPCKRPHFNLVLPV